MAKADDELVFVALGGLGEIGMNAALYGYGPERKRQWLLVDCGVAFAGDDLPGIDLIMPDLSFIENEVKSLAGIVITHAHEDHIGAIVDLWPRLKAPVYATRFAASLLEVRRMGEPDAVQVPITVVEQGARRKIGPFDVEFIAMAHSIPESTALAIRTPAGTALHTGDWKIDPTPQIGLPTDEARLQALGDEGVLALICDSTNVLREGISPSEADVASVLAEKIAQAKHRVCVTTFASNVARIKAVGEAARRCGRQVVVVGRAMERVVVVARELGMLGDLPPFLPPDSLSRLPRDKIVALVTGSQGEPRAALARIAEGEHPEVKLDAGDRVIFSSRAIPGNEKAVNRIINNLVTRGVEVITDRQALVHVSGHPRQDELRRLYQWVRPKLLVPAHGEALHLTEHAAFAKAQGIGTVIRAFNGEMVRLGPGEPDIMDDVPHGRLYKDGEVIVSQAESTVAERRKLGYVGVVSVAIAVDKRGEVAGEPEVAVMGLPVRGRGGVDMLDIVSDAGAETLERLGTKRRRDPETVETAVERAVRSTVSQAWGKKPVCHVLVIEV
jgi:ribonuclease J